MTVEQMKKKCKKWRKKAKMPKVESPKIDCFVAENGPHACGNLYACAFTDFKNRNSWAGRG